MTTNYIVVAYLGDRRSSSVKDPVKLLRLHLKMLKHYNAPVDRVTMVINSDGDTIDFERMHSIMEDYTDYYTELKVRLRQNVGHSYGGWNDTINANIQGGEPFDRYFLVEDDYVPSRPFFLEAFESKMTNYTGFVCQKIFYNTHGVTKHAAISNGMLSRAAAEAAYKNLGSALNVRPSQTYYDAEWNQLHFLENIFAQGFDVADVSDIASVPFISKRDDKYEVIEYGVTGLPMLLKPVAQ